MRLVHKWIDDECGLDKFIICLHESIDNLKTHLSIAITNDSFFVVDLMNEKRTRENKWQEINLWISIFLKKMNEYIYELDNINKCCWWQLK